MSKTRSLYSASAGIDREVSIAGSEGWKAQRWADELDEIWAQRNRRIIDADRNADRYDAH